MNRSKFNSKKEKKSHRVQQNQGFVESNNDHLEPTFEHSLEVLFKGHGETVDSVIFYPCCQRLASASYDNSIRVWDTERGNCMKTFDQITDDVIFTMIKWTTELEEKCNHYFVSGSLDGSIISFSLKELKVFKRIQIDPKDRVVEILQLDNDLLLSCSQHHNAFRIYSFSKCEHLKTLTFRIPNIHNFCLLKKSINRPKSFYTVHRRSESVQLANYERDIIEKDFDCKPTISIDSLEIFIRGSSECFVAGGKAGDVVFVNTDTNEKFLSFEVGENYSNVVALKFIEDRYIFIGNHKSKHISFRKNKLEGAVSCYDFAKRKFLFFDSVIHDGRILNLEFHSRCGDSILIITSSNDKTIRITRFSGFPMKKDDLGENDLKERIKLVMSIMQKEENVSKVYGVEENGKQTVCTIVGRKFSLRISKLFLYESL